VTTTSEVVLVACLVRQQLLQHVVTVRQYAAEEFVVAADGQLRRRSIVGMIETKPYKCFNAFLLCGCSIPHHAGDAYIILANTMDL